MKLNDTGPQGSFGQMLSGLPGDATAAPRRRRGSARAVSASEEYCFVADNSLAPEHRIARLLYHVAVTRPGHNISWTAVAEIVFGLPSAPAPREPIVKAAVRLHGRVRHLLKTQFSRELLMGRGLARASIDEVDAARTRLPGRLRSAKAAAKSLIEMAQIVDLTKLSADPETRAMLFGALRGVPPGFVVDPKQRAWLAAALAGEDGRGRN